MSSTYKINMLLIIYGTFLVSNVPNYLRLVWVPKNKFEIKKKQRMNEWHINLMPINSVYLILWPLTEQYTCVPCNNEKKKKFILKNLFSSSSLDWNYNKTEILIKKTKSLLLFHACCVSEKNFKAYLPLKIDHYYA